MRAVLVPALLGALVASANAQSSLSRLQRSITERTEALAARRDARGIVCARGDRGEGCLLRHAGAQGGMVHAIKRIDRINELREELQLPSSIVDRIAEVAQDNDGQEHAFSTVHESVGRTAEVHEVVGSAVRRGDLVEVAVARARAFAHVTRRDLSAEEATAVQEALLRVAGDRIQRALGNVADEEAEAEEEAAAQSTMAVASFAADGGNVIEAFTSLVGGLSGIADSWTKVVGAFKTTTSRTIVGEIEGKGFSSLKQSVSARQISGLTQQGYDMLMPQLLAQSGIPAQHMAEAQLSMLLVQYSDAQTWVKFDMLFEKAPGGQVQYVCVAGNRNPSGTTNWVIASMGATFKLAPNARIIRNSKSVAGGIFEKTSDKLQYEDRSITPQDIESLLNIMSGLVLEGIGSAIGVRISLPMPN